jgi:hypothetical protein
MLFPSRFRFTRLHELLVLALVVAAGAALAGCGTSDGGGASSGAVPSGSPIRPEPPAIVPFEPVLAEVQQPTAAAAHFESRVARLKTLATELAPELSRIPVASDSGPGGAASAGSDDRHMRWELRFPPGTTLENYARQLDVLKIELGVIGGNREITYLSNLANPKPQSRTGASADDSRLYLVWQRGEMRTADLEIAKRAGVPVEGRVMALFLPREIEDELARVEESYAKQINMTNIGRTVFGLRAAGADTFRFFVIEQQPAVR